MEDRKAEADRLFQQGIQQYQVSQFREALQSWEAALQIYRVIGDRRGEGYTMGNLGVAYTDLGQYQRAIELYEQQLSIARETGDRRGEGNTLNNLGNAHRNLGQYQRAIELYEQQLSIAREIGDRQGEGNALGNLGVAYYSLGQNQRAIESYQQALGIAQEIGDREGEGLTLSNIRKLLNSQKQPELAIVFLKQSVNVRESIRGEIRGLDRALQQSYTDTVSADYRLLADLLLQENRVLEAQRVLDLLKVQELDDYLRNVQRSSQTAAGVDYWRPEQRILKLYAQVIAEGTELAQLDEKAKNAALSAEEQRRYDELMARRAEIRRNFNQFSGLSEVQDAIAQLRDTTSGQNIEVAQLQSLQSSLRNLNQNAALLYPLILDDRLELVLVTPNAPPVRKPVDIKAADLNRLIVEMGQALKDSTSDIQPIAQQLYQVLIQPIEAELAAANAKTIIYAPDGALRYIPLPALHDGTQWLAQRFAVTHITAASLTNFAVQPSYETGQLRILAGACSQCEFNFTVAGQPFNFRDLPFARREVENIAAEVPGTETLIDQAFSPDRLLQAVRQFPIVHLATHAAFVQGEQSVRFEVEQAICLWRLREAIVLNSTFRKNCIGSIPRPIHKKESDKQNVALVQSNEKVETMMNEMNSTVNEMNLTSMESIESGAIELSEQDLEAVSGGLNLSFGDVDSFFQQSGNFFSGKKLSVDQATFAGPNGSGTMSSIDFQQVDSGAFQNIGIG